MAACGTIHIASHGFRQLLRRCNNLYCRVGQVELAGKIHLLQLLLSNNDLIDSYPIPASFAESNSNAKR